MSHISRRKVVKGAAWATPVIAASSVVPAYAASPECTTFSDTPFISINGDNTRRVEEQEYVHRRYSGVKLRFELIGGAGATLHGKSTRGGSGAKVTGIIDLETPAIVEVVAGGGGMFGLRGYGHGKEEDYSEYRLDGSQGGAGFGDGGSVPSVRIPQDIMREVESRWAEAGQWDNSYNPQLPMDELHGCPGGGSSALLVNGEVIAVAGGGGGGAFIAKTYTTPPNAHHFPGTVNVRMIGPEDLTSGPSYSAGGSAERARGDDATAGRMYYAQDSRIHLNVEGGKGGGNGIGGAGGIKPTVLKGTPNRVFSFSSQNNQVIYSSSTAGNPGTGGLQGKGGDGVVSISYQLDNNEPEDGYQKSNLEVIETPDGDRYEIGYEDVAPYFNGAQIIVSGAGGGGYGGGGSGAALSQSCITIAQKWNNNPKGIRQSVGYTLIAGAGGAGGSYLAPNVIEGEISSANNDHDGHQFASDGSAAVYLCDLGW